MFHVRPRLNPRYGFLWWIDPEAGAFAGHGHLDTHLHVIPKANMVIVRMQAKPAPGVREGAYERAAMRLYPKLVPTAGGPSRGRDHSQRDTSTRTRGGRDVGDGAEQHREHERILGGAGTTWPAHADFAKMQKARTKIG